MLAPDTLRERRACNGIFYRVEGEGEPLLLLHGLMVSGAMYDPLTVTGKGGKTRQVLLREAVSTALLALRGDSGGNDPLFPTRTGTRLKQRAIGYMLKRTAKRAGITQPVSPHWLRHAHGSHALDRGATLAEVQTTLGHANVATTSGYLHARPNRSSGSKLDEGIFR